MLGIIIGAVLAFVVGWIINTLYGDAMPQFSQLPVVPAAGGVVGGILSAVLVIKSTKFEQE